MDNFFCVCVSCFNECVLFCFVFLGPKPDAPRNVTFQRMAQGWVLSWLSPLNISVAVAYYRVEYRREDEPWRYTDPIPYDTAYLCMGLYLIFHFFPILIFYFNLNAIS